MPDDWAELTRTPESTTEIGRQWLEAGAQLAMRVPSVVCPSDFNLLLNPMHPDMAHVRVVDKALFSMDPRLFGTSARG
ncbi:RES family NAD+ phosphorylase [Burkholderia stagnalis]|uniref:RES family NAD+ phosphorylase n=1 Tax=Burkholderia stagnalis TaxID=1503054 RepID=UPI001F496C9A|nr:RES family NAD+ phosphorylase [Burkholderia stagnalis]